MCPTVSRVANKGEKKIEAGVVTYKKEHTRASGKMLPTSCCLQPPEEIFLLSCEDVPLILLSELTMRF